MEYFVYAFAASGSQCIFGTDEGGCSMTFAGNSDRRVKFSGKKGVALISYFIIGVKEYSIHKTNPCSGHRGTGLKCVSVLNI